MSEKDLSSFAAFDLDDLLEEIDTSKANKKEVTAYLDREFIINMINQYQKETAIFKNDFTTETPIDLTDYNFTGADLRGFKRKELELFKFNNCDISQCRLDRVSLDYFRDYMINREIIFQGVNLSGAYLGPVLTRRIELGIQCNIYLNISNLNFSDTNFSNCDIKGLILQNTNISHCNFTNVINFIPEQFAFSLGFDTATFSSDSNLNREIKDKIKYLANKLDPNEYYKDKSQKPTKKLISYIASLTNIIED